MDKISPRKEIPEEEVARESIIAISYSLPDKILVSENPKGTERPVGVKDSYDGAEKYRSELISIANSPSPDIYRFHLEN